jgi:hypothetical protein
MEEMIARWIRETKQEYETAKKNVNAYKMRQMTELLEALYDMRENLIKPRN